MCNKMGAFQFHLGIGKRVVFPNGHIAEVDQNGMFKTIILFPKVEREALLSHENPAEGRSNFEWECAVHATGSPQVVHQKTTVVGPYNKDLDLVMVEGGTFALPHEEIDETFIPDPLAESAG